MDHLHPGQDVEVQTRFDGAWVPGFRIERALAPGYLVSRLVDGATLPEVMLLDEVRSAARPRTDLVASRARRPRADTA
ncbi:MAG: hypothetical protein JWM47_2163 [Acidimicrobiales bacterium]|nr:hypothetical protein [Acidimicrobiales bacterium]